MCVYVWKGRGREVGRVLVGQSGVYIWGGYKRGECRLNKLVKPAVSCGYPLYGCRCMGIVRDEIHNVCFAHNFLPLRVHVYITHSCVKTGRLPDRR